eukprot:6174877-Alexandrium_andersonii.AAC.1
MLTRSWQAPSPYESSNLKSHVQECTCVRSSVDARVRFQAVGRAGMQGRRAFHAQGPCLGSRQVHG